MSDLAIFWLPIIGSILLGGFAIGERYSGNKTKAIWFGMAGVVCFGLIAIIQARQFLAQALPTVAVNSESQIATDPHQTTNTKETEARRLQAYVGVQSVMVRLLVARQPMFADLTIKNFGATPASAVQISGQPSAELKPDFLDAALNRLGYTTPESLFPTAERIITLTSTSDVEGPNQMQDALHPNRAPTLSTRDVLVYGLVRYRDIFDAPHSTEFCYTVSPGRIGQTIPAVCQEHNGSK